MSVAQLLSCSFFLFPGAGITYAFFFFFNWLPYPHSQDLKHSQMKSIMLTQFKSSSLFSFILSLTKIERYSISLYPIFFCSVYCLVKVDKKKTLLLSEHHLSPAFIQRIVRRLQVCVGHYRHCKGRESFCTSHCCTYLRVPNTPAKFYQ